MTTKHLAILCAVILGTFSLVFVLPKPLDHQPVGVVMNLPDFLGPWYGRDAQVTAKERQVLGDDTDFARKNYLNSTNDHVFASIVLSGQDMMTGIHRPERCLQAQGWTTGNSSRQTIDVPGFGPIQTTRLQTSKKETVQVGENQPPRVLNIQSVSYYFFIGYTGLAATHEQRVMMDFCDRIFHGYNQRWAMVMLTSEISAGYMKFGRDEKQTDEFMAGFIKELTPHILGENVQRHAGAGTRPVVAARE